MCVCVCVCVCDQLRGRCHIQRLYYIYAPSAVRLYGVAIGKSRHLIGLASTATVPAEKAQANTARASVVAVASVLGLLRPPIVAKMDFSWDTVVCVLCRVQSMRRYFSVYGTKHA